MPMVSMKDIARRCNVSVATVSKALSGQSDVGPDTKARIAQAAEELGYLKNSAASTLKTRKSYNLGILFVDEKSSGLTHEYFSAILESFKIEAEQHGYDITFINRSAGNRSFTYLQHARYRGFEGVVIACVDFNDPQVIELVNSDIPVVTIDHIFNNRIAVVSDNLKGTGELLRYAYAQGHRRIGIICGESTSVTENRMISFYQACRELGLELPEEYVLKGAYHDTELCRRLTKQLLSLPEPPTCIFFPDDFSYIGGYNAIWEAGLTIPGDISAIGYDGIPLSRIISPKLTTWCQDAPGIGRTAARSLISLIEDPKATPLDRIVVHGHFQEGGSVRKI